ncbi:hypothetical protein [Gemmiger formicilis]|uniref:hypothetical protein n=1 Tax=Gemmiger formicilis TaxID=745368 RepID=UPI003992AA7C
MMGELSQRIGKKLEHYGNSIFEHLEWKILAQDVQIDCIRAAHKNAKSSDKKTHGVDILAGYYNPFTKRQEAFIIECKHREWSNFIPSNLSLWVEELCNTIECASTSPALTTYLEEYTLIGGILLYNSSDNIYEMERALKSISQIKVPRRRHPLMIYLADNSRLEKWYSFNAEIAKIKQNSIENSFGIIYPSIGGSTWDRSPVVTPTYLFSDYILASYIKSATNQGVTTKVDIKALFCFEHVTDDSLKYLQDMITNQGITTKVDIKALFCFEHVTDDSLKYLRDMINELQLESRSDRYQEVHFYFYPETEKDIDHIKDSFSKMFAGKDTFKYYLMDNRRLSRIYYES